MKLTIIKGLWIGFVILLLSLVLASVLIDRNIRSMDRIVALESMGTASFGMEINVLGMGLGTLKYLDKGDPDQRERVVDDTGDYERYKVTYDAAARSDAEKHSSEHMNVLFAEYREVSVTLMDSSDEQRSLLAQVAEAWEQIDQILDKQLQPVIDRRSYQGLEKVEAAANVEADVAEVATWVATYLQNPRTDYRDRIRGSADEVRTDLAGLHALSLTPEKHRMAHEIESIFASAMENVARILDISDLQIEKRKRFKELRDEMDDVLDDEIQAAVTANMNQAKAEAEQTVQYLRLTGIGLLLIGLTITATMMFFVVRRSRQLEVSNLDLKKEIGERERSERHLSESRERLRSLTGRLQTVREEERMDIARRIHDELGQLSTAMIIDLSWLEKRLPSGELANRVDSMMKLSDTMLETARRISSELRTGLLDEFGLAAAIDQQVEEFKRRTGIICDLVINLNDVDLDSERAAAAYYIFQEAMTNIARHAHASNVNIVVEETDTEVILQIDDNGKGASQDALDGTTSLGVIGMRERAAILRGEVSIISVVGKGTRVTAHIPREAT